MSHFYKITSSDDSWYKEFWKIYSMSFPIYEQRNSEQQLYAFENVRYNLFCQVDFDKGMLNSFISFWEFDEYVYIEHLAVNERLRGNNIGTTMLEQFKDVIKKTVILEIDPIIDNVSQKRLEFYQKLDFRLNPYEHYHPAYDKNYKPHKLLVLSTERELTPDLYQIFKNDLDQVVMKCF